VGIRHFCRYFSITLLISFVMFWNLSISGMFINLINLRNSMWTSPAHSKQGLLNRRICFFMRFSNATSLTNKEFFRPLAFLIAILISFVFFNDFSYKMK